MSNKSYSCGIRRYDKQSWNDRVVNSYIDLYVTLLQRSGISQTKLTEMIYERVSNSPILLEEKITALKTIGLSEAQIIMIFTGECFLVNNGDDLEIVCVEK